MFLLPATLRLKLTIKRLTRSPPATVKWWLKNALSGKRLSGNRLVRETSVRESDCPGNDRTPFRWRWSTVMPTLCPPRTRSSSGPTKFLHHELNLLYSLSWNPIYLTPFFTNYYVTVTLCYPALLLVGRSENVCAFVVSIFLHYVKISSSWAKFIIFSIVKSNIFDAIFHELLRNSDVMLPCFTIGRPLWKRLCICRFYILTLRIAFSGSNVTCEQLCLLSY